MQDACAAVDGFGSFEHLIRCGAGEDGARAGGVKHSHSHKTTVHGFMTAASTGDQAYFSLYRRVRSDNIVRVVKDLYNVRVSKFNALKLFDYDIFGLVD